MTSWKRAINIVLENIFHSTLSCIFFSEYVRNAEIPIENSSIQNGFLDYFGYSNNMGHKTYSCNKNGHIQIEKRTQSYSQIHLLQNAISISHKHLRNHALC